jgi:hypothetical protein
MMMTSPVHLKSVAALLILSAGLSISATSPAAENSLFLLNYDIEITTSGSDDVSARIQQQGIRFSPQGQFHDKDLGQYDYLFSLSDLSGEGGRLTIEIYRFESREKTGDTVAEYISVVEFQFGVPVQVEANTDGFSVDLALSISSR